MFRTMAALTVACGLAIGATTALAGADSDSDAFAQDACDFMGWQYETARQSHQNHANFARAAAIGDRGLARCGDAAYDEGSVMLRVALQMINVPPLF